MPLGAAHDVVEADGAGVELHRAAGDRDLAEVEPLTGAAGAAARHHHDDLGCAYHRPGRLRGQVVPQGIEITELGLGRSEEHTSELQSLMRISYAVFCMKKKNQIKHIKNK